MNFLTNTEERTHSVDPNSFVLTREAFERYLERVKLYDQQLLNQQTLDIQPEQPQLKQQVLDMLPEQQQLTQQTINKQLGQLQLNQQTPNTQPEQQQSKQQTPDIQPEQQQWNQKTPDIQPEQQLDQNTPDIQPEQQQLTQQTPDKQPEQLGLNEQTLDIHPEQQKLNQQTPDIQSESQQLTQQTLDIQQDQQLLNQQTPDKQLEKKVREQLDQPDVEFSGKQLSRSELETKQLLEDNTILKAQQESDEGKQQLNVANGTLSQILGNFCLSSNLSQTSNPVEELKTKSFDEILKVDITCQRKVNI